MKRSIEEKNEPTDEQMFSAVSFCIMLVLVGIPLWWKTTEVYRVSLPYSEIDVLHELNVKIKMNIHVVTIHEITGEALVKDLENLFKMSKIYSIIFKHHAIDKALLGSSKTLLAVENKIKHPHFEGSLQLFEVPGLSRFTPHNIIVGQNRTVYFSSDTGKINDEICKYAMKLYNFVSQTVLNEAALVNTIMEVNLPVRNDLNEYQRHKLPLASDFDILFTVLNPEPEWVDIEFNLYEAIEDYISPLADQLKDMHEFHIKSQWLYFVGLQAQPKFLNYTDKGPHFALSADLLPHVITPLEKKLASHVSKYPCLNFILYVPPCRSSPIYIYTSKGHQVEGANAFISPKWGGIQVYNPDRKSCMAGGRATVAIDEQYAMSIFLHQFRLLLGIPDISEYEETNAAQHLSLWEKDFLLRTRTVDQLTSAKLTLQSLSKLLGKINNIVINDQVGEAIHLALENIHKTTVALRQGNLTEAYKQSKMAFLASEKAFTDPSLLALLYFPDDQKYAVYIPLFLPIMIPVLISFKHIAQWGKTKLNNSKKLKMT
ncbi:hypothetical protein RUM44_002812 [Polyplax serrata]|uniref:GPI transamidase component PIG-S n=1 Tax=Polyplax serrata TaxID=468196 RepID=A0ABR1AFU6_POLSC